MSSCACTAQGDAMATVDWYEKLRANNGAKAADFARFYPAPGMAHCGGRAGDLESAANFVCE